MVLPKKGVVSNIGAPYAGSYYYYSGAGDNLDNFMYKSFNLPAGATLTAKVKYNIELDWDYAYLVYSTDNGVTWTASRPTVHHNRSQRPEQGLWDHWRLQRLGGSDRQSPGRAMYCWASAIGQIPTRVALA